MQQKTRSPTLLSMRLHWILRTKMMILSIHGMSKANQTPALIMISWYVSRAMQCISHHRRSQVIYISSIASFRRTFWQFESRWCDNRAFREGDRKTCAPFHSSWHIFLASWSAHNSQIERRRENVLFVHWTGTVVRFTAFGPFGAIHFDEVSLWRIHVRGHAHWLSIFEFLDGYKRPSMSRWSFN